MLLPPLAFGNDNAKITEDLAEASETIARIVPSMRLTPASSEQGFRTRISSCSIGGVRMVANAATVCRMDVEESRGWHLILPLIGKAALHSDGRKFDLHSGASAMLMPNMKRFGERTPSSVMIAAIDIARLQAVMATVAGHATDPVQMEERPLLLIMQGNPALFRSFLHLCSLIDATRPADGLGETLGLDDLLYRWIGSALSMGGGEASRRVRRSAPALLDGVCDLVRSTTHRPLTLTEMAESADLSVRALQYAFKTRFGCSPMEWQRRERILMAHARLSNLAAEETVTSVAHSMGFSSSAAFATLYKRQFGESPSQTVQRYR